METQKILRNARESQRLSLAEVAAAIGTTPEHVRDLEDHRDELELTLSVEQCIKLLNQLHLTASDMSGEQVNERDVQLTLSEFVQRLRHLHGEEKQAGRNLADEIGYEIEPVFEKSDAIYGWNLDCLKQACARLGLNWAKVLSILARDR